MRLILAWLALLAALTGAPAAALPQLPARPAGPVYDGANVITPADEATLDARLRAYNQSTGRAVIVATVPTLDGEEIEPFANQLARAWDIGGKETESGVLFLVAPAEHKLRIENARGLDDRMTDIMSGRIIRDVVVPRFKANDMSGGIVAGTDAIIKQLNMDPAQAKAIAEAEQARQAHASGQASPAIAGVIFWVVLILFFTMLASRRRGGRAFGGGGSGIGNVIMWGALNAAMNSGRSSGGGGGFGDGGGGGFGGFGGGGGGFSGGGASGSW
ncbi:MAG: TPM domain-containing protein [Croceibacterium sp.]